MIEKVEVKLCSNNEYKEFINEHSKGSFLQLKSDFSVNTLHFISELPSIQIEKNKTILELARIVWNMDELVDQSEDELVFKKSDGNKVVRKLLCHQLSIWPVPVSKTIDELYYKDKLVFVYDEDLYRETDHNRRLKISLERNPNPRSKVYTGFVRSELPNTTLGVGLKGVVLSTSEEPQTFSTILRRDFGSLIEATDPKLELIFLEKENSNWDKSFLKYWDACLEIPDQFETQSFVGHTSSMPFDQKELFGVLPGIEGVTGSTQVLLYWDLTEGYLLLDIDSECRCFFDTLIRTIWYVDGQIKGKISELKESIGSRLELVELPPYQTAPGSRARMQEALAHSKARKMQEQQGRVAPENVYKEIDAIFKVEGKELESFEYFKEQFLAYYPDFQNGRDHLLQGENYYKTKLLKNLEVGKNLENDDYQLTLMKRLSRREIEVLKLIAQGMTTEEIADKLLLVPMTVVTLRKNMQRKLELEKSADLFSFAIKACLAD
ncbi:helix-turn-helix transcriptional regulator [Roseivirga sp. E12]|uniref:helix-turn-helix domain-containing protein n=1 Tax=Roseivirga sp. E12 TaxID=2819237 RepID=UPI001ABD1FF2|nr:helix-turn-helix transcriptional regulator [Roseivirga sp. E12]MBO3699101.1 helix-turn-helix transcriptional regulator [Roseivirga sp. E12]